MSDNYKEKALEYHRHPRPGKLTIEATKPLTSQQDLALAYSPGVAYPCLEIAENPLKAREYTARGNLIGVVSNGTAVLGLGNIGSLASKPVMEGKAVLFKRFAGIDVFDIEINENDPHKLAETIERLEPTFGGINLEDIKAPDCFYVEEYLRSKMSIPVFHDDQHGTAIVVAAAMQNALTVAGKSIESVKLVASGAGAAAISCLNLLVSTGMKRENITVTDYYGVVYLGREQDMDAYKAAFAVDTDCRTLGEVIKGADIFLGLSAGNVLKAEMIKSMAEQPIVFALANPTPEIDPEEAHAARDDIILATGRSDYPNQVNNVLCFPFLFRGALDVGATEINEDMKIACVKALADLAKKGATDVVSTAYQGEPLNFGPEYLIPKPFDQRLILEIAPAVARAAMDSGVALNPIEDWNHYMNQLNAFVFRSGLMMKPVFDSARSNLRKVVFAEGEEMKVLQAVDFLRLEKLCKPIVLGRVEIINNRIAEGGLGIKPGVDFDIIEYDYNEEWCQTYHKLTERAGKTRKEADDLLRTSTTIQAALMVKMGLADSMICGTVGRYHRHLQRILSVTRQVGGINEVSAMTALLLSKHMFFICDTHVTPNPSVEAIVKMTLSAAEEVRSFGITPKVALLSHSNFGSSDTETSMKMRKALGEIQAQAPNLMVDGEMRASSAMSPKIREIMFPSSTLEGSANLLIMPNLDAANITYNLLKTTAHGLTIGPILLDCGIEAHITTPSSSVRGLVNLATIAASRCNRK
ncbi:MAG: malate dehydrogenase (oxaloacetate-decarboxylating)(NADP+) [Gammaproteobacteria bacterium]|jgi:malate dehydrogenase (oxaloacetate-decarboxylating)(NADP+)